MAVIRPLARALTISLMGMFSSFSMVGASTELVGGKPSFMRAFPDGDAMGIAALHPILPAVLPAGQDLSACLKRANNGGVYSITSSAMVNSEGGTTRPNNFAAFRLTVSLKRDGCSTGRSAGLAPLRILSV